ncbi:T9SS sorting signal type C domain-containing protein [Flavobacterium sp. LS2P90]|uniref:T9SS sorting signal type C domain-containing protein n=1 Tax=Flavobacterium xylosi TaxID=3230415 RepID=A0ABW6HTR4_9FLAO
MRLISTIKKYYQDDNQILTTFSFLENIFSVNARKILFTSILFFAISFANAATVTSNAVTGNWSATSSWVGGKVPALTDDVIIVSGAVISLTANINQTGVVTVNAGGTLSDGGFSFGINNNLNPGMTVNGTFNVRLKDGLNKNGGGNNPTVAVNSGGLIWLSTTSASVGVSLWDFKSGSIVKLDALGAQTLDNSFVGAGIDFLILAGSGVKSLGEATTVSQNLSMQGSATLNLNGKILTYGTGSVLEYSGWTGTTGSEWPATFSTATGGIQVINNSTVTLNENKTLTSIPLTIKGGSTLANGLFTLTAPTSLTLECGATGSTLTGTGLLTLGGNVTVNKIIGTGAGATISCPVALGSTRTFTVADETTSVNDLTLSGVVSNAFGITKNGLGTLELSGTNTYPGVTTVTAGVINVKNNSGLGTTAGATTIAAGAAIQVDGSGLIISEPINTLIGTGVSSGGALRNLANSNTWSGAITLGSGGARINSDLGTLTITGGVTGATLPMTIGGSGNTTFSTAAIATTTGTVTKDGSGSLTMSFSNTYTGNLTVNAGSVTPTVGQTFGSDVVLAGGTFTGGSLTHNVAGNWTNNGTFTAGTSTINFNSTAAGKTISGTLSGAAGKFNNLSFNGVNGGWSVSGNLDIANALTVTNGAVSMNGVLAVGINAPIAIPAGGGTGTLTLENNASLVQTNYTGANTINIIVKRNSTPIINDDYTYWSSPTTGSQTLLNFSPNTQADKFFIFNNDWVNVNALNTFFTPGIGYAIRSPEGISSSVAAPFSFRFTGVPNNGPVSFFVTAITDTSGQPAGLRLIGNPYPSALNADAFIDANITGTGTLGKTITGTLYFWTHNNTLSGNNYSGNDYATYTKAGGVGTPAASVGTGNSSVPTKNIASGQGFFVEVDASGSIFFDNTMRGVTNTNTNFYKAASASKKQNDSELKDRIWLNLTNTSAGSQALVGYMASATNGYDPGYDGMVYDDASPFALYSILGNDKLAIQAKTDFVDTDVVPFGYAINTVGKATISIDHVDGLFLDNQMVYLEDKLLNVIHDIRTAPYNFSSAAGTFNERFVLRYTSKTLGTEAFDLNENTVIIAKDKNELKIKSALETIKRVTVFDLLGRKVFDNDAINNNEFRTSNIALSKQAGLVKVTLTDGKVISKKVIF